MELEFVRLEQDENEIITLHMYDRVKDLPVQDKVRSYREICEKYGQTICNAAWEYRVKH